MGAEVFMNVGRGDSASIAFSNLVGRACSAYGNSGYSGSIAEKGEFKMIECPEGQDPRDYAEQLIDDGDARVDDKWGPAGCIDLKDGRYLFFGWASS